MKGDMAEGVAELVFDEEDGLAVREPLIRKGYEDVFDKAGVILKKEEKKKKKSAREGFFLRAVLHRARFLCYCASRVSTAPGCVITRSPLCISSVSASCAKKT